MKKVVLVHGWDGSQQDRWFPWLKGELESHGYTVVGVNLPDAEEPRKEKWVPALADAIGTPNSDTYFVAHSMGTQAVLRFLESLPGNVVIGGAVFVAGFVKPLANLEGPEEEEIASSWTNLPLNLAKVREHLPRSIAIFSDNDPWVTLDNVEAFRSELGSEIRVEAEQGHFNGETAPAVLDAVVMLAGS